MKDFFIRGRIVLKMFLSVSAGDPAAALPQWPDLEADSSQLPPGIDIDDLQAFVTLYRDHCEVGSPVKDPYTLK